MTPGRTVDVLFQFIAEAAAKVSGFQVAVLNVVRGDYYEVVAVAGSAESEAALLGTTSTLTNLGRWESFGVDWGSWRFIEAGSYSFAADEPVWIPSEVPPPRSKDEWHPLDMLTDPEQPPSPSTRATVEMTRAAGPGAGRGERV